MEYSGALQVCQELWHCSGGKIYTLEGGIDEYKEIVQQELAAQL